LRALPFAYPHRDPTSVAYFSLIANSRRPSTAGVVVFTTIGKFMPAGQGDSNALLSERRRNIVVIADEAHRSHYDFIDGFARHMRDALSQAAAQLACHHS
jgi:type I site-specific restriction-modification system R (restriction) subunit